MFIATRTLNLGGGKQALPGEPVDISSWPYAAKLAHINLGFIEEVPDKKIQSPQNTSKKNKRRG